MAVRTFCDKCGDKVVGASGSLITVHDTTHGVGGEWDLCDLCTADFAGWLRPVEVAADVR